MKDNVRGSVDVWLDDEHIVDYTGFIGYGYGVYWKQGIYRAASPETVTVDYRDLWIDGDVGVRIEGTPENDKITPKSRLPGGPSATDDGDIIEGRAGADLIRGGLGHDLLFGGDGNDALIGGRKSDTLIGGTGNDRLKGGKGNDVFRFEDNSGRDVIKDFRSRKDLIAVDRHLFQSEADFDSSLHNTKAGAVLSFAGNSILFKGVAAYEVHYDDILYV
jgi:Ca2+-binding RTX toxin-like protein